MHIRNHIAQCQSQWSTNFQEFLAFLIGELIEGSWAEMNQFAGSTKETNHGHRHDIIDDGCGQWNWDKVIQMGEYGLEQCDTELMLRRQDKLCRKCIGMHKPRSASGSLRLRR